MDRLRRLIGTKFFLNSILAVWVALWLAFFIRGLVKTEFKEYSDLWGKTLEEKRAIVTGREFYEFIKFCETAMPPDADFKLVAQYDRDMDYFRFPYYVYPMMRNLYCSEYIVCYKTRFEKRGYERIASLSGHKYILRRIKARYGSN